MIRTGVLSRTDVDQLIELIRTNFMETEAKPSVEPLVTAGSVRVAGLYVYPVKSCGGVSVSSWTVTQSGLEYDRQWMITQGKTVLTQKREPLLSQIRARVDLTRRVLVLSARFYSNLRTITLTKFSTLSIIQQKDSIFCIAIITLEMWRI